MSTRFSTLPKGLRFFLLCLLQIPYPAAFLIMFDLLPEAWRWEHWSQPWRMTAFIAFWVFATAEKTYHLRSLATPKDGTRESEVLPTPAEASKPGTKGGDHLTN